MNYKLVKLEKKFTKDPEDDEVKDIIEDNCFVVMIGKPGDGKSTLISQMLLNKDLLCKKYDAVLFFTPGDIPNIKRNSDFRDTFDSEWLNSRLDEINGKFEEKNKKGKALIIFDDMITTIERAAKNKEFEDLIFRRRWIKSCLTISYIFTTQYFKLVPKRFRESLTHIVSFNLSPGDLSTLLKEYTWIHGDNHKLNQLKEHFLEKHSFIVIHRNSGNVFLNFDRLL